MITGYDLLRPLSEGRGAAWQARGIRGDVVVKVYRAKDEHVADFASRAAQVSLLDDAHLGRVRDRGQSGELLYVARDYFASGSLVTQVAGMTPAEKLHVAVALGRTIEEAHRRGVCHGALKPENVFFDAAGDPVLVDFSFSGSLRPTAFAAPEQRGFYRLEPAVDQYSYAMLVAWLMLGRVPELAETIAKNDEVDRALRRALSVHSAGRFHAMDELVLLIERSVGRAATAGDGPFKLRVDRMGSAIRVHMSGIWTQEGVDSCIRQLSRILDAPGSYALGYLLEAEGGCHSAAIDALAALHLRYRGRLSRVAFVADTPQARGSSVLIGQRVDGLPWKTFTSVESMMPWLREGLT